jgi:hypothetical protein
MELDCEVVDSIYLAAIWAQWRDLVDTVIYIGFHKRGNFFIR